MRDLENLKPFEDEVDAEKQSDSWDHGRNTTLMASIKHLF